MAKKDWLSVSIFHSISKENITNTEQISWDSSSSEDEHPIGFNKRRRQRPAEVNYKLSPVVTFKFKKNNVFLTPYKDDKTVQFGRPVDSPVIGLGRLNSYKLSPELSQRSTTIFIKEPSPVIEKRRVRLKKKNRKSKENNCPSPELFNFELTQNITSDSPIFSSQATVHIEPFLSQCSSQVQPSNIKGSDSLLYFEPPKRKKNFKKGGVAHQLDKALKVKKSRIKIWHHEKINHIECGFEDQGNIITFKVKKVLTEYGNTLLQCEIIERRVTSSIMAGKEGDGFLDLGGNNNGDTFLLHVGANSVLNIQWEKDNKYYLFPSYNIDRVKYCGQRLYYYSRASKFMA